MTLGTEALGLTITAAMLFGCGAAGGWGRAKLSDTQRVFSQRTIADMLVGGFGGVLLPVLPSLAPTVNQVLLGDFNKWNALQQAALAFFAGATGSYMWTKYAWKKGIIATPAQVESGVKPPPPEVGVLAVRNLGKKERRDERDV